MPQDRYANNSTNYSHPQESNVLNVHKAMTYNSLGEPVLRTTSGAAATANDAFGRLRISQPFTLFDTFHRYQDNGKISTYSTGTGSTSTFDAASGSVVMSVGTGTNSRVYRESTRVFAYQPGKSLQILQTYCLSTSKPGLRQRYGYFDTENGIFLEINGNNVYFVRRTKSYGVVQELRVPQSEWNIDPLDGTGISTKVIYLDRVQIMFIDVEWLGVGSVRCGFVIDGEFVQVHQFNHANSIDPLTGVGLDRTYMTTACLPVRAEIENTTTTTSTSSLRIICASVISEGGYELRGRAFSIGHRLSAPRITGNADVNAFFPVLSIRLKQNRLGAIVVPKNFSIAPLVATNYEYRIVTSAVTSGGQWISAGDDSSVEYNLTATEVVGGVVRETGYIITTNQSAASPDLQEYPFAYQLERNTVTSPPTCYEFVIEVACSGNQGSTVSSINWDEIT